MRNTVATAVAVRNATSLTSAATDSLSSFIDTHLRSADDGAQQQPAHVGHVGLAEAQARLQQGVERRALGRPVADHAGLDGVAEPAGRRPELVVVALEADQLVQLGRATR